MILSWDNKNYKGSKEQRQAQNTNKVMMKLEHDTATKAGIWTEDKWFRRQMKYGTEGERQMMEDTQRRTGERARHHH